MKKVVTRRSTIVKPDRYWHAYCDPCRIYLQVQVRYGRKVISLMCPQCGRMSVAYTSTPYPLRGAATAVAYQEKERCRRKKVE